MKVFDRSFIESFALPVDETLLNNTVSTVCEMLSVAVENISKSKVAVTKLYEIIPDGELASGAISSTSTLNFLLVLNSPQLILNTQKLTGNKLKTLWIRLKSAWRQANSSKKEKKKLKKKKQEKIIELTKYTLNNFSYDLLNQICLNLSNLSVVTLSNGKLTIEGEDFPFVVEIKVLIKTEKGYGFYDQTKNKIVIFNYGERYSNLKTSQKALALMKIYNNLFYNLYKASPNQIFIESLIYNMPESMFELDEDYEIFIKSINYLNTTNLLTFKSVVNNDISLWKEPLNNVSLISAREFINRIISSI